MLRLRRIELVGFKSFHDRSEIRVDSAGVTAVVGPNGCGKSNISDAVAWVLGEQRARSLRGDKMEDVIFNGSGRRSPLGMAEVSMSLIDDAPFGNGNGNGTNGHGNGDGGHGRSAPSGPVELTVQRRLFRSGESQYLLNGRPCRLRDIQDIFLGTGLGPNSYAIIEQGRIGQILSARPTERRALVEEAAGITKFKAKRKLAESRLQAAEKNLARVSDILSEVERQRNSLKRQASKARRYREVRQRLREVLARVFSTRAEVLVAGEEAIGTELEALAGRGGTLEARIGTLGRTVHESRGGLSRGEKSLEESRDRRSAAGLELEKAQQRIERQEDRVRALESRKAELTLDLERLIEELGGREAAREAADSRLREVAESVSGLSAEIAEGERALGERVAGRRAQEEALESLRGRRFEIVGREARLANEITGREELLGRVRSQTTRVTGEREEASAARDAAGERLRASEAGRSEVELRLAGLGREIQEAESRVVRARGAREEAAARLAEAERHEEAIRHRLATIRELSSERAYGTESLQDFFGSVREEAWAPLGIVADFIEVAPEYESVIEDLLHVELQYIVVGDLGNARLALAKVREANRGRLDFFVLGDDGGEPSVPEPVDGAQPVSDLVRFDPRLRSFGAVLGRAYVAADFESAWRLSMTHPGRTFVARSGEVVRDRVVSWGERSGRGPLSLKREMRELDRRGEEARARVGAAEETLRQCALSLGELESERKSLEERLRQAETEVLELDHRVTVERSELERAEERLRVTVGELSRLESEGVELEAGVARARSGVEEAGRLREEIDQEIRARTEAGKRLAEVIAEESGRVAELREKLAAMGERREAAERELSAIGAQIVEVTQRHERAAGQIEAASRDRDEALASIEVDRTRHQSLSGELAALDTQIRADLEALEVARRELNAREAEWDEARSAFDQWKDSHNTARIEQARIGSELRHLVGLCQSELGDSIESVCLDTFETLSEDELEVHEEEHRSLRQRLDAIGNVNMMAVEEYEEAEQRFVFLSTQRQDLFDSIRDTTQAIAEIDSVSSRRFGEAFREINGRFRQAFLDLFGGGHGELRLLEEGESQDAGIEIVAQPPGKKLQNVLLLSGGEKALTALALVIALFRFRPSPFCVLDEVDAPLDDANVDRFANMIRIMSEETQFIVITHSKRTMETANQLYGVTMEEPGVSKVVSVRLN